MGIFTWTDAVYKTPRHKDYIYFPKYKVQYGRYAKLICPDDTEIETEHHDYYGRIGGHDIYELVAEWNREDLPRLFKAMPEGHYGKKHLTEAAKMYAAGASDEEITAYMHKAVGDYTISDEWKRTIGIAISCDNKDARKLKYPIKLTKDRDAHGYANLYVSYSTQ